MPYHRLAHLALAAVSTLGLALPLTARAAPMDGVPDPWVVDQICASRFGGPLASVLVYRADEGEVARYELHPDISRFSHAPVTIFSARGDEVLVIAEHPIVPGSPEALAIARQRADATRDTKPAETLSCAAEATPIHALAASPARRFVIAGTVVRAYACPPCPPRAECKPCDRDHVVVSERAALAPSAPLGASEVVVYTTVVKTPLAIGQAVRLRVATWFPKTGTEPQPGLELLALLPQ